VAVQPPQDTAAAAGPCGLRQGVQLKQNYWREPWRSSRERRMDSEEQFACVNQPLQGDVHFRFWVWEGPPQARFVGELYYSVASRL
jgi:hypothetical protein